MKDKKSVNKVWISDPFLIVGMATPPFLGLYLDSLLRQTLSSHQLKGWNENSGYYFIAAVWVLEGIVGLVASVYAKSATRRAAGRNLFWGALGLGYCLLFSFIFGAPVVALLFLLLPIGIILKWLYQLNLHLKRQQ